MEEALLRELVMLSRRIEYRLYELEQKFEGRTVVNPPADPEPGTPNGKMTPNELMLIISSPDPLTAVREREKALRDQKRRGRRAA